MVVSIKFVKCLVETDDSVGLARLKFCMCLREIGIRHACSLALFGWQEAVMLMAGRMSLETERVRTTQVTRMLEGVRAQLSLRARLPLSLEEELSDSRAALQHEQLTSKRVHNASPLLLPSSAMNANMVELHLFADREPFIEWHTPTIASKT